MNTIITRGYGNSGAIITRGYSIFSLGIVAVKALVHNSFICIRFILNGFISSTLNIIGNITTVVTRESRI